MTPYASDEARKAAHARKREPTAARQVKPLSKAAVRGPRQVRQTVGRRQRLANLQHRLQSLVNEHFSGRMADDVAAACVRFVRAAEVRALRDHPETLVAAVHEKLREFSGPRRDATTDLVLAAQVLQASAQEDRLDVVAAVKGEAARLPLASPEVGLGFLAAVESLHNWFDMGVGASSAVAHTRSRWASTARGRHQFLDGVELALTRFQSRYGGKP